MNHLLILSSPLLPAVSLLPSFVCPVEEIKVIGDETPLNVTFKLIGQVQGEGGEGIERGEENC